MQYNHSEEHQMIDSNKSKNTRKNKVDRGDIWVSAFGSLSTFRYRQIERMCEIHKYWAM